MRGRGRLRVCAPYLRAPRASRLDGSLANGTAPATFVRTGCHPGTKWARLPLGVMTSRTTTTTNAVVAACALRDAHCALDFMAEKPGGAAGGDCGGETDEHFAFMCAAGGGGDGRSRLARALAGAGCLREKDCTTQGHMCCGSKELLAHAFGPVTEDLANPDDAHWVGRPGTGAGHSLGVQSIQEFNPSTQATA